MANNIIFPCTASPPPSGPSMDWSNASVSALTTPQLDKVFKGHSHRLGQGSGSSVLSRFLLKRAT